MAKPSGKIKRYEKAPHDVAVFIYIYFFHFSQSATVEIYNDINVYYMHTDFSFAKHVDAKYRPAGFMILRFSERDYELYYMYLITTNYSNILINAEVGLVSHLLYVPCLNTHIQVIHYYTTEDNINPPYILASTVSLVPTC